MPENTSSPQRQVLLQRIYLKDASLEVPLAPQIFARPWNPKMDVEIGTSANALGDNHYQVTLKVTVTAKLDENAIGFLAEVQQAGVFQLNGFASEQETQAVLAGYCPGVVFPFARETVADLVQRGGFPPLLLQPINFEALFAEYLARARQATAPKPDDGDGASVQ
jgi:preprotein translocase subunit SecB